MILRDYQEEAVQSIIDYYTAGNTGNPVVAMPTGTGKSLVIGGFIQRAMQLWPGQRFMMLTHVKELIEQNAAKLQQMWPQAPLGIYSAGLKRKDVFLPIIYGGVGSVVGNIEQFGHRDLLLVDECHLISPNESTVYQRIIERMRAINPDMKVIGFSATHYRMGLGYITENGIFTDICCDMTGITAFNRFIQEGHLAPLIPRRTKVERQSDMTQMGSNGDLSGASLAADAAQRDITYQALIEMCENGQDRRAWMIFASTIEDADYIADTLNSFGIPTASVHTKMPPKERDKRIRDFKEGRLRCVVNKDILTTGFDHPPLDLIGMLRRTMSPGLWVQMLGRGTRPSPETRKENCLVLDFAGNTRRLGPINDPQIPKKKGSGGGDAPCRICEDCGTYNHAAARFCIYCGAEFTFAPRIVASAGTEELIRSDLPIYETYDVQTVYYYLHEKANSNPSIRVTYYCGMHKFDEWVAIEHKGFPGKKARDWWRQRTTTEYMPETVADALQNITLLRAPSKIRVWCNKRFPEIVSYEF